MLTSNVKKIMEKKGISLRVLMRISGVSKQTIERARENTIIQCSLDTLQKIANGLDCKVKDLFEEEG